MHEFENFEGVVENGRANKWILRTKDRTIQGKYFGKRNNAFKSKLYRALKRYKFIEPYQFHIIKQLQKQKFICLMTFCQ